MDTFLMSDIEQKKIANRFERIGFSMILVDLIIECNDVIILKKTFLNDFFWIFQCQKNILKE